MKDFKPMTGDEFRRAIERLGISQMGLSRHIGVDGRTIRGWIADRPVPRLVALYMRQLIKDGAKAEELVQ